MTKKKPAPKKKPHIPKKKVQVADFSFNLGTATEPTEEVAVAAQLPKEILRDKLRVAAAQISTALLNVNEALAELDRE